VYITYSIPLLTFIKKKEGAKIKMLVHENLDKKFPIFAKIKSESAFYSAYDEGLFASLKG
jgi:hypothetical protein